MKVNFNQPFKNYKGEVIIEDNGAPQLIKNVVSALLFSGKWLEKKQMLSRKKRLWHTI